MDQLASPVRLRIRPSASVTTLVYGGHVLILISFLVIFPLGLGSIAGVLGVVLSLVIQVYDRRKLEAHIDAILLGSSGEWSVAKHDGEIVPARLTREAFISPWLVVLRLTPRGERSAHIVLARDNTDRDSFRRLRVRLRIPLETTH